MAKVRNYSTSGCNCVGACTCGNTQGITIQVLPGQGGARGTQGTTGAQGIQGSQGTQGHQGVGTQGPAGTSVTILGQYATEADLIAAHPTGNPGDAYVVGTNLYVWNTSAWENVGPIVGPQGIQGSQGLTGAGTQGTSGAQGAAGSQGTLGTQGATGAGAQGIQGVQGSVGTQGAVGSQGTTGAGTQGAQGHVGTQGTTGTGTQGTQGATGSGTQGTQGVQGPVGSISGNTDSLAEGTTNLYFTPARVAYNHVQGVASATWTIHHNLHFYPNVTVQDSAGNIVEGEITYTNSDSLTVTFSTAFSGEAYLS
jgi:hypothetical protein